jgi:hypothetical protein
MTILSGIHSSLLQRGILIMSSEFYLNAPSRGSRHTNAPQFSTTNLVEALQASIVAGNTLGGGYYGAGVGDFLTYSLLMQGIKLPTDHSHPNRDRSGVQRQPEVPRMAMGGHF